METVSSKQNAISADIKRGGSLIWSRNPQGKAAEEEKDKNHTTEVHLSHIKLALAMLNVEASRK